MTAITSDNIPSSEPTRQLLARSWLVALGHRYLSPLWLQSESASGHFAPGSDQFFRDVPRSDITSDRPERAYSRCTLSLMDFGQRVVSL
jgi:hypothetical protein